MALDLSADSLIRAGSGVLFFVAGLIALVLARRSGPARALAVGVALVALGLGAFLVPRNILSLDPQYFVFLNLELGLGVCVQIAGAAVLVWHLAPASHPRIRFLALGAGLVVAIPVAYVAFAQAASLAAFVGLPLSRAQGVASVFALQAITSGLLGGAALAFAFNPAPKARAALALGLVSLDAYFALTTGTSVGSASLSTSFVAAAVLVHTPFVAAGFIELRRGHVLSGRIFAWGVLGLVLAESVAAVLGVDSFALGIIRSVAAAILAYVILRSDSFGTDARPTFVRRGTLAAAALATLFIVAQIAQNFFSAEFGLLTGGIVAGAFLFAASPIQRAMERMGDARADRVPAAPPAAAAPLLQEDRYRAALRLALRDRRVTRDEEIDLHRLADGLGISAGRAHEMLVEIERETGVR